jgi:hypothetical protein
MTSSTCVQFMFILQRTPWLHTQVRTFDFFTSIASIHALASRHIPHAAAHLSWTRRAYAVTAWPSRSFIRHKHTLHEDKLGHLFNNKQIDPLPPLNHSSEISQNRFKFGMQSRRCSSQVSILQLNVPNNIELKKSVNVNDVSPLYTLFSLVIKVRYLLFSVISETKRI